jgi:hypothetical protein
MNARLYGDGDHAYAFSEQWYADRAALLGVMLERNRQDIGGIVAGSQNLFYSDASSDTDIVIGAGATMDQRVQVRFGGSGADALEGRGLGDRLYGASGNDRLSGLGGADHLEGGAGADVLDGGAGNDTLYGGEGQDLYEFTSGHGQDVIVDADGLGSLTFDGQAIEVGKRLSEGSTIWEDTTGRYRITRVDEQTLRISAKAGQDSIIVKSWHDGDLGLVLGDDVEEPQEQPASLIYLGDQRAPKLGIEVRDDITPEHGSYGHYAWAETQWQPDGTLQGGIAEGNFADVISAVGQTQGVQMFGLGGNDAPTRNAGYSALGVRFDNCSYQSKQCGNGRRYNDRKHVVWLA